MNELQCKIVDDLNVFMDALGMAIPDNGNSKIQDLQNDSKTVRGLTKQWSMNLISDDDFYAKLDPIVQKWI